ncbi:MAG TPA: phosphatase PAP2 family protein, partial [Sulfuricurvum sp.]|nr:phosphatase PAP2 family protein [Sulfuricurvum sp.]
AMQFVHAYSRPWLNVVMLAITQTGGVLTALVFIALLYWLYWLGEFRWMWAAAVSFLGPISVNALLKLWFARPRPDVFTPLIAVHTFSFPSGHTAAAVSLYGFLAFVLWRADKKPLAVLSLLWVFLVALSRVYLGVHYPSDVLGALTFGGAWLLGVMGWFFMRGS